MIADLFCGAGGWLVAAQQLELDETGYDNDAAAAATYNAAGGHALAADLTTLRPLPCDAIVGSPPCQSYSLAGKRLGRDDPRGMHPLTLVQWAQAARPQWVAAEQVPGAHSMFVRVAAGLATLGYKVALHELHAEQYGVPQTRTRLILMAHRDRRPQKPPPTHSRYYPHRPSRLDPGVKKWVTLGEALDAAVSLTSTYSTNSDYANRGQRHSDEPAPTVTSKINRTDVIAMGDVRTGNGTIRAIEHPSATLTASMDNGNYQWIHRRPSTTIVGSFRPDIVAAPEFRKKGPRQNQPGSVTVTVAQAGILQSFPADYPWQGTLTDQYRQVGNAIPPLLALAVLTEMTRTP